LLVHVVSVSSARLEFGSWVASVLLVLLRIVSLLATAATILQPSWYRSVYTQAVEWITAEQAARHLGCESVKAFEKIAFREGIPKHYLSARAPRYNRAELDSWLLARRQGISG
jgi:hypothetical protein